MNPTGIWHWIYWLLQSTASFFLIEYIWQYVYVYHSMIISLSSESKIKRKIKELTFSAAAELEVLNIFKNQLNSFLKATIVRVSWDHK
jgi:hypothetical protein